MHRRPPVKGSFGGHLEELVKHFPHEIPPAKLDQTPKIDRAKLKERIDIHALLFQQAWQLERDGKA